MKVTYRDLEKAEEEAEQFFSDVQADYEDFINGLKRGAIKGLVEDGDQRDMARLFTGSRTDVMIEISGGQGKWIVRDKGNTILSLSLPSKVCELTIAILSADT